MHTVLAVSVFGWVVIVFLVLIVLGLIMGVFRNRGL